MSWLAFALATTITIPAHAAVTIEWSAGSACGNRPYVGFTPGGSAFEVSLCASTTTERGCGFSAILQAADTTAAAQNNFVVMARALGERYPDPNAAVALSLPIANPPFVVDFGGTASISSITSIAPGANQLLATFTIAAQMWATNPSYKIFLSGASEFATDQGDVTCGESASFGEPLPVLTLFSGVTPVNVPNPPTLTRVDAGPGGATLNFLPATNDDGSAVASYTASCAAPGQQTQSAVGSGSPIAVTGLTGGVSYTCTVSASNSAGITGAASGALTVVPAPGNGAIFSPLFLLLLS